MKAKIRCTICNKKFAPQGFHKHMKFKHAPLQYPAETKSVHACLEVPAAAKIIRMLSDHDLVALVKNR